MILYTNGDEYTAAAKVVNNYSFANDDYSKVALGRKPHPDNLNASWSMHLSKMMQLALVCEAESYCSNERILRTTYDFIHKKLPALDSKLTYIVIGWTGWDREEWYDEETKDYVYTSNLSTMPSKWENRYKLYSRTVDWQEKNKKWDAEIWELHHYLNNLEIPHLFFNSMQPLNPTFVPVRDWRNGYVDPYNLTYQKFTQVRYPSGNGPETQVDWAQFLFSVLTNQVYP